MRSKKHILVIRLSAMGDIAMTVPVLSALINQNPEIKITVLTREFFSPIFAQLKNVEIFEADVKGKHKGFLGLRRLSRELKTLGVTHVADLHNVLRSNILKAFFKLNSIPVVQINKGRKEKKDLTALKQKNIKPLQTTHERYADVFRQLGFIINLSKKNILQREPLEDEVLKLLGTSSKKWIGIAPFAAFKGKMYPLELMENVIKEINASNESSILLFGGGKTEKNQLQKLANLYPNCINIAGNLSFKQELNLISNLDLMLAMDSGNAHLAAMYGIPTVTLWGVTHPYAGFAPFGQEIENCLLSDSKQYPLLPTSVYGNKFPEGYDKVMYTIKPKKVLQKLNNVLSKV